MKWKAPDSEKSYQVKIRYRAEPKSCKIERNENGGFILNFSELLPDPAPGQYAVLYDKEELIGGGQISEVY